jgi:NSS family neurotransmitter:Na+ symporter
VAHFRLLDALSGSTIGTLFVAIPKGMASMGGPGRVVGLFFFLVLAIAALTSAVSLLDVSTAGLIDRLGWSRRRATWLAGLTVTALGLLPALDNRWIDLGYTLFGETGLIFGGLMTAILLGWLHPGLGAAELAEGFPQPRADPLLNPLAPLGGHANAGRAAVSIAGASAGAVRSVLLLLIPP